MESVGAETSTASPKPMEQDRVEIKGIATMEIKAIAFAPRVLKTVLFI